MTTTKKTTTKKTTTKKTTAKDVEAKDVEAKDVEAKDVEAKDVEVKDVKVKDVEVKDVEVKDVEVKIKIEIVRGRMPLALVHLIRFKETGTVAELAAKYRTTVGKIDDINKNKNFSYIREDFKPDGKMIEDAKARCIQLHDGTTIMEMLSAVGTDEGANVKLKSLRVSSKKVNKTEDVGKKVNKKAVVNEDIEIIKEDVDEDKVNEIVEIDPIVSSIDEDFKYDSEDDPSDLNDLDSDLSDLSDLL